MYSKIGKVTRKIENSGKTESAFLWWICIILFFFFLFVIVVKKFSGEKNRDNYKGKPKNSGKLQKL
jgi:hypothetical protein